MLYSPYTDEVLLTVTEMLTSRLELQKQAEMTGT